ncbi:MAG: DUF4129 domain-containing protein [Polyangiaceae bacterium]|nr:DUF4129 domain-containing protein [Polyangiaceae bacterium]
MAAPTCTQPPESPELETALGRALDDPHGFCKNPDYGLGPEDTALCGLAEAAAPRCPGFAAACSLHPRTVRLPTPSERIASLLGSALTFAFWTLLALGALVLLRSLVAWLVRRARDSESPEKPEGVLQARVSRPAPVPSSQAPEALLSQAHELAARGAFGEAMSRALTALLRSLEIRGALQLHASRTNGEYLRQLRSNRSLCDEFRHVTGAVEAVEFGGQRPSPARVTELMERISRVMGSAATVVLLAGLGMFAGCGGTAPSKGGFSSTCGTGAAGYSALCEMLGTKDATVRKRFQRVRTIGADVGQIVVLQDVLDVPEQRVLREWAAAGGTLVIMSYFDRYGTGLKRRRSHEHCQGDLEQVVPPPSSQPCTRATGRLPDALAFDHPGYAEVLATCGSLPFAVRTRVGAGSIVAIADPRLAMNAALSIEHNAALVHELLEPSRSTIELIGRWTSSASGLPVNTVIRAGLLPWLLHMILLCLAYALCRGAPFGTRHDVGHPLRRAFVEHARALGEAYARAHASRLTLAHYGSWALDRLRIRAAASGKATMSEVAAAVAARLSLSESQVMRLIVAVRSSTDEEHDSSSEAEHLAVIRELSSLAGKAGRPS